MVGFPNKYVSRGGIKLQAALDHFKIDVSGKVCLDIGSSTGGFVDCLLQNGAQKVYAVDTAYGELAWKLRNDPRVAVMERTSVLHLTSLRGAQCAAKQSGQNEIATGLTGPRNDNDKVDLITIDAGWTKLELVLPVVKKFLKTGGKIIALLKPHYETKNKRGNLVRGVVPKGQVESIKNKVLREIEGLGFKVEKEMQSPILGGAGNKEFLLLIRLRNAF